MDHARMSRRIPLICIQSCVILTAAIAFHRLIFIVMQYLYFSFSCQNAYLYLLYYY